jgi:SSS family solute:Na+ symporter
VSGWLSNSAVPRAVPSADAARGPAAGPLRRACTNLLVGGLLVPILGGLLWKRGTAPGALSSVVAGGAAVVGLMAWKGILANEPVYYGLLASLVAYAAVSLATKPTDAAVLAAWRERLAGRTPQVPVEDTVPVG